MECIHIKRNPDLPRHILPCRDVFCLDCTKGIEGLMDDELFTCPNCGNYSQYVDAAQTVEGRPGTVATDDHKAEEKKKLGRVDPPAESLPYDERREGVEPLQPSYYDRDAHAPCASSYESDSQLQPTETGYSDAGSQSRDLDTSTDVSDTTRKDQDIRMRQIREGIKQNHLSGQSNLGTGDQLATQGYCKYHSTYKLKYSCSCKKLVCKLCTQSDHRVHESVLLEDDNELDDAWRGDGHQQHSKKGLAAGGYDVGKLEQRPPISRRDVSCVIHPESEMFFFCNDCEIPVCTHCTNEVHKLHSVMRLDDETNQSAEKDVQRVCPSHMTPFRYYCKSCKSVICMTCHDAIYSYHYSLVPITRMKTDISVACQNVGRQVSEDMATYQKEREASDREAELILQKAEALKEKVKNETDRARRELDANAEEMMRLIDKEMQTNFEARVNRSKAIAEIELRLGELEAQLANAHRLVQSNDLVTAKLCSEDVKEKRSDMKKIKKPPPPKSFDLECHSNPIPACNDSKAPVFLAESSYYSRAVYTRVGFLR